MRLLLLPLLMLATVPVQAQQRQPSDVELKAAYCIHVVREQVSILGTFVANEPPSPTLRFLQGQFRERSSDLDRLQSYLLPKLPTLEANGLLAAARRAQKDIEDNEPVSKLCATQCKGQEASKWPQCLDTCFAPFGSAARLKACEKIDFLPF